MNEPHSLVLRILRVGEASGDLVKPMKNVTSFYEREVKESIQRIESMVMPIMTLVLAALLLWILLATLMPLYDSFGDMFT